MTSKSIRLSTVQAEMYVGIIGGGAMDSKGLFSLTGVKCDFPVYQVIGECASKVICAIGSCSECSDGDLTFNSHGPDDLPDFTTLKSLFCK